jgi:hypothetical protein
MINNNVTLDVSKTTKKLFIYLKNFFIRYHFRFLFCLNLFLFFFCFVKLALGLNNVCKVRCTNKQKRKTSPFCLYQKSP